MAKGRSLPSPSLAPSGIHALTAAGEEISFGDAALFPTFVFFTGETVATRSAHLTPGGLASTHAFGAMLSFTSVLLL
jgi:hypothetical protein